jgi:hypothetical protein
MGIFKAKRSDLTAGPDVPIDQVYAMKQQGYSNNQIIQTMQRDGYTSSQIFDAISQSEMAPSNPGVSAGSMQDMPSNLQGNMGSMPMSNMPMGNMPPPDNSLTQLQTMQVPNYGGGSSTEEMIEAIIDEKWNELVRDINKVIEWKQKADNKLSNMEQQMNDLKEQFDKLHQAIIGKIGEYDKHMLDVGSELQAMEKVFSKVLPAFVDNVNELSRITDRVKGNAPQQVTNVKSKPKVQKSDDDSRF